ncbi:hypothetical protein LEN26_009690 [Aphanomyces euteiches]|nr:hypothetical protein AeMF1_018130 [Aphanomyces euteiches]KAH9124579.1 hypothetical protein LEN26_009690 [Aphanomyces euteiches]KAH9192200.1 hypothetical protein AeNC1_005833 [Aphanomyces euteiches]
MSRSRTIRFEEYASSGPVTSSVVCQAEEVKPSKSTARFAASKSHQDNEKYLAAFDSNPQKARQPAKVSTESLPTIAPAATSIPPLRETHTETSSIDDSARTPWLQGPNDPSGRAEAVSAQPLTCMSLSLDESEVVVGSCDHALYAIPLRKTKGKGGSVRTLYTKTSGHGEWVTSVAHLADGRVVSGGMDSKLCLWEGNRCEDLTGHAGSISLVRVYSDNLIVSASYDKTYRVWDGSAGKRAAKNGRERHCLKGHDAPILDFAVWGGSRLIGGDRNGSVLFFDLSQGAVEKKAKAVHAGHCTAVLGSCHSTDQAFSGGQDGILRLWDVRSKAPVFELACHAGQKGTGAVSFIQDMPTMEHVVVTGGADGKVQVVDTRMPGQVRATFSEHSTFIYSLHLHHDLCFSGDGAGMLLVHDLRTDRLCYGLGANRAAVRAIISTQRQLIAAGDDGSVLIYDFA